MSIRVCLASCLTILVSGISFSSGVVRADDKPTAPVTIEVGQDPAAGFLLAPKVFRASVKKVLPSVVIIESFGGVTSTSRKGRIRGISRPGDGPTTGLIVSADGYVVTSTFNFIRQPPVITVVLQDGRQFIAKLMGRDLTRKICILKLEGAKELPVPEFVDTKTVRVGQWSISVGFGYGDQDPAMSAGIISGKNRVSGKAIQTDSNISPANYGGPLIDIEGRVLGVCVPLNPRSQGTGSGVEWYDSGIGFAIPLAGTEKLLAALKAGKTLRKGGLGVNLKPAKDGVGVLKVVPKSPAAKAGIKVGDKLIAINEHKLIDGLQMRSVMGRFYAGDKVKVHLERDGKPMVIDVVLEVVVVPKPKAKRKIKKKATPKKPLSN